MKKINMLLCFFFGLLTGYFVSTYITNNNDNTANTTDEALNYIEQPLYSKQTANIKKHVDKAPKKVFKNQNTVVLNSKNQLSELSTQIDRLNKEYQTLENKYERTKNRLMEVTLEVESLDESNITDEQMMALVNDTFAEFRRGYRGKQRDKIFDFHQQEDDVDWGYDMKTKLSDFILTHYNANDVQLSGISCKQASCELLIIETEKNAWGLIFDELTQQPWWQFRSTNSSSRSGENNNQLIYLFLSK